MAATTIRGHSARGTVKLWREASATNASRQAPIIPVVPRSVSGGRKPIRYLVTGQLNPQPIEVMARKASPAGAMRALAPGWISDVMGGWVARAAILTPVVESAPTLTPFGGSSHGLESMAGVSFP